MTYVGTAQTTGAGGFHPLTTEERAYWGATHVAIVTWEDMPAGIATATAQTLGIATIAAGQLWQAEFARVITPFANGADAAQNTTSVTVGDTESATQFLAATETNLNGAYVPIKVTTGITTAKAYTAADILQIAFAAPAAGKTLSNLTQGEIRIYFRVRDTNLPA